MREPKLDFRELIERFLASESRSSKSLFELVSKGLLDPGMLFSKMMGSAAHTLLKPDFSQGGGRQSPAVAERTERAYNLLWLSYEKWLNRGAAHLYQAGGLWTTFYGSLRWELVRNRHDETFEMDQYIAEAAQEWLVAVHELTAKNFRELHKELNGVLAELQEISGQRKELRPIEDLVKDDSQSSTS